jgi:hypothetical protein
MLAVTTTAVVFGWGGDRAAASTYPMYQCRDALSRFSSIRTEWTFHAFPGGRLYNVCAVRGDFGIMQTPSGQTGNEGQTRIAIAVPASASHVSVARVAVRAMIAPKTGGALSHGWVTVWSDDKEVDNQALPDGPTPWINRVDTPLAGATPAGARSVAISVACFESCQFSPWESVQIRQAVFSLSEDVAPAVGAVGGSLLEAGVRRGVQTLTFDAADADSGVRSTQVLVDGAPVAVDDLSGACHYDDFAPCPTSAPGRFVSVDASRLAKGEHRLVLRTEDAAGNVALKDVGSFATAGGSALRLTPTAKLRARYAVTLRPVRTLRWDQRFSTRGRLTGLDGRAMPGVRVLATIAGTRGRPARTVGQAKTRRDGSWSMRLRARFASGRVRFVYVDGRGGGATATLRAKVRAGVRLAAARHVVAPFGRIALKGRLLGGPVPRRGKVIEIRARGKGEKRWITFKTVRTDAKGRFSATHKLKQGYRNVTYEFQAVARADGAYPYETGASNVERVSVR